MSAAATIRVVTTCANVDVVRRAVRAYRASATVEFVHTDAIRHLDPAGCLIVDVADLARTARATGFEGGIVVFAIPRSDEESEAFLMQGTHFASPDGGAAALTAGLGKAVSLAPDGSAAVIDASVSRTRRLLAAGELAVSLRHAFNNPLAALMAEVQLLQLEARDADVKAATERMLELVRRLTELSRSLESVRDR